MPRTGMLAGALLGTITCTGAAIAAEDASAQAEAEELRSWSQKIDDARKRFEVLDSFHGDAVLDRETQIVWQQSPDATFRFWSAAVAFCNQLNVDGRLGWRMPTVQELASLVDPTVPSPGPALPTGHPFDNVQSSAYWSITSGSINPDLAWVVSFQLGQVSMTEKAGPPASSGVSGLPVWCARGGLGSGLPSNQ